MLPTPKRIQTDTKCRGKFRLTHIGLISDFFFIHRSKLMDNGFTCFFL